MTEDQPLPLFPGVSDEERQIAERLAAQHTAAGLKCDSDDVLLASNLSAFGDDVLAKNPQLKTKTTRAMFRQDTKTGIGSCIILAQLVRRLHAGEHGTLNEAALDAAQNLLAVVALHTERKGPKFR